MTFNSMILKNIKHNIKNYTSFLLANSIIQCILFMFFTLIFSKEFLNSSDNEVIKQNLNSLVVFMIAFSIVFIIFSTISFTKYRGKEFGVYFTIGLTSKEVIKILTFENMIISVVSFISAILTGSIFSKLFHLAIGKILKIDNISIPLNIGAFVSIAAISIVIFFVTSFYQMFYLKKYSVVDILKSKQKKNIGGTITIAGVIGIGLFIVSSIVFKIGIKNEIKNSSQLITISILGVVISLYLLIGYSMTIIVKILKRFKKIYNNDILFLNSLTHRFMHFRTVLYVVTLMVAGAVSFISIAYGTYKSTKMQNNIKFPYDISFVIPSDKLNKDSIKNIITKSMGEIKEFNALEGINIPDIRVSNGNCIGHNFQILAISEDSYKSLGNEAVNLNDNEAIYMHVEKANELEDSGVMLDLSDNMMRNNITPIEEFKESKNEDEYIYIPMENVIDRSGSLVNYFYSKDYARGSILILSNDDYSIMERKLGLDKITYEILINVQDNNNYEGVREAIGENFGEEALNSTIIKMEEFNKGLQENSFNLFLFSFMGMMFFVGSAAILYFKTMTSLEEDKERSTQLVKLGLTKKEIFKLLNKELRAIFLVPPVIAICITAYFLRNIYNLLNEGDYMWRNTISVFLVYSAIQIIFYYITSKKYKRLID